jgi:1-phosphofructokinase family hexose kinase
MLVTLTPNPSVDRTLQISEFRRGAVLRATSQRLDPGGKGVNVARATIADGGAAVAVLPVGGHEGQQLMELMRAEGVDAVGVDVREPVRSNITIAEPDGTVTKLNEAGPELDAGELDRLLQTTVDIARARDATWIAGCGSLPRRAPDDLYATLVRRAHDAGLSVAIDTSGPPLAAVIDAAPDLIKPNIEELAELVGRPLADVRMVAEAAAQLCRRGVGVVLVSLGPDGAVLVTADEVVQAVPPAVDVASTVGAGDATLAGYLAARSRPVAEALADAVAWGTAAVALPGTRMPGPKEIAQIRARVELVDEGSPIAYIGPPKPTSTTRAS